MRNLAKRRGKPKISNDCWDVPYLKHHKTSKQERWWFPVQEMWDLDADKNKQQLMTVRLLNAACEEEPQPVTAVWLEQGCDKWQEWLWTDGEVSTSSGRPERATAAPNQVWNKDWEYPEWDGASPRIAHYGIEARLLGAAMLFRFWHSNGTNNTKLGQIHDLAKVNSRRLSGLGEDDPVSGDFEPDAAGLPMIYGHPSMDGALCYPTSLTVQEGPRSKRNPCVGAPITRPRSGPQ